MMERIPVKNAHTANMAAISMGIVSTRLLKNVSPPRWPKATRAANNMKKARANAINLTDQAPSTALGL